MIWLFLSIFAAAAPLDSEYLHRLLSAHDAASVRQIRQIYLQARDDQRVCEIQLATDAIPWACYRLLKNDRHWQLYDENELTARKLALDRHCRTIAQGLLDGTEEAFAIPLGPLSDDCRHWIARAKETARYRREENDENWRGF